MTTNKEPVLTVERATTISLKEAQAIVELARAHAEKIGVPMNIAVVE